MASFLASDGEHRRRPKTKKPRRAAGAQSVTFRGRAVGYPRAERRNTTIVTLPRLCAGRVEVGQSTQLNPPIISLTSRFCDGTMAGFAQTTVSPRLVLEEA